ncbi:ABC transporter ATP-binding protein [Georgenia sp. 10Sc9-8]|uniref:ABC transporter ATP-binding protein n=1 Tax=Georgenia halotolerans TaxID=3028317 RepID=A0ABT5U089_9MICO|nr:ABC transporter ATP-binding protein [Georgenia halotolerans]
MIQVSSLTKRYGRTVVVDDVSIDLQPGGLTSIIGANGAGKSTVLSMIARLLPMDGGAVVVDGMDVATTPGNALARRLSILKQDNHLAVRLTVQDLVAFGRYPHSRGRLTVHDRRKIAEAMDYLELGPVASRYLDELSGGQRQRAFVAMVLCQDTDYVLLDEPLNNLDMKHSVGMMQMLRRTADELGKTVVLVVHDINFASCYSDHIVAMKDGRILCHGSPEEIIEPGHLREIYDIEVAVEVIGGKRIGVFYN